MPRSAPPRLPPLRLVAVGASTGGPEALVRLLRALGGAFPIPVLVALHAEPPFADRFPDVLDGRVPAPVRVLAPGMRLPPVGRPGVWLAPPGRHVRIEGGAVGTTEAEGGLRPSADVLFGSLAPIAPSVAVVVLSGLDHDGARGLALLRRLGALTLAQDPGSALASAMPRAAGRPGGALHRGPPEVLARLLWTAAASGPPPRDHPFSGRPGWLCQRSAPSSRPAPWSPPS